MKNKDREKIVIDENFYLTNDSYQWVLHKDELLDKIYEKTGKRMHSRDYWYYPTVKMALKKYLDESLKKSPDISSILQRIDELETKIDNL